MSPKEKKIRTEESPLIAENPTICDCTEMARGLVVCSIDFSGSRGQCTPACPPNKFRQNFRLSIFRPKNGQNKARIGPFDPGRRGSIDLDARNRLHPTFPGQKCKKYGKLGKNCRKNWTIRKIFGPSQYTNRKNMDPFKGLLYFLPSSLGG